MKQKKFLIVGIILFVLLIAADLFLQYSYQKSSALRLDRCIARADEDTKPSDECFRIQSAADSAYSFATSNHIATYAVLFSTFLIVLSRLDQVEGQIKELENLRDV